MSPHPLESVLDYHFKEPELLLRALTHSSYANEHNGAKGAGEAGIRHWERLEFLGDTILNAATTALLFERYPRLREGQLSTIRRRLINESSLAGIARQLGLGAHLRLSVGEHRSHGEDKDSLLSDAVEAIVGAIYNDGGWHKACRIVQLWMGERLDTIEQSPGGLLAKHPKSALQEYTQHKRLGTPEYVNVEHPESPEERRWEVVVRLGERAIGSGFGTNTRDAGKDAAATALSNLTRDG